MQKTLTYQSGFWNYFESEALPGALPRGQNSPQACPMGLYAELFTGTSFLAGQRTNLSSWFYRIKPSVCHGDFVPYIGNTFACEAAPTVPPMQLRWDPLPDPKKGTDFIDGLKPWAITGDAAARSGSAVHLYHCNTDMTGKYFFNSDGDFLIVPQTGTLLIKTEFGQIEIEPQEIAVIPRGTKFQVSPQGTCRGYICENFGEAFRLPDRGPIGSHGLANARDFLTPNAHYEEKSGNFTLVTKFLGKLWQSKIDHSPLNVVAWHGNYTAYKYDLRKFQVVNSVSYDHNDPSIFTVLTSPSSTPGTSNIDFVIFPPRWMVAEHTFRPPYFHRNVMSEYMGLIVGQYDSRQGGFVPGGGSLHNVMCAHGPEASVFEKASTADLKPVKQENTMAFMFESRTVYLPTREALETPLLQKDYLNCWAGLKSNFRA